MGEVPATWEVDQVLAEDRAHLRVPVLPRAVILVSLGVVEAVLPPLQRLHRPEEEVLVANYYASITNID